MPGGGVHVGEVISYGFRLLGTFLLIGAIAGGLVVLGGVMGVGLVDLSGEGDTPVALTVFGWILVAVGFLVFYAGLLGISYKVVADGVRRGMGGRAPAGPALASGAPAERGPAPARPPQRVPGERVMP